MHYKLSEFKLLKQFGAGSRHAEVYLAKHPDEKDKFYAIKVITKHLIPEQSAIANVFLEYQILLLGSY